MRNPITIAVARAMGYESHERRRDPRELLERTLALAARNVPYYREIAERSGVLRGGSIDLDRFEDLPLLDKKTLRDRSADLISPAVSKWRTYWNSSGGSTGEPTRFLQDRGYARAMRGVTYAQKARAGYRFGDPMIKLWGDDRDLLTGKRTPRARLTAAIKNIRVLNSFRLTPERMREYARVIEARRPRLLLAYAQALYELCRFAESNGLPMRAAGAVMTSAGTLYPFMRETIRRVTGCDPFDRYGGREVGNMACECDRHEGLHVADNAVWIEILDEHGRRCEPGVEGEIVVTGLLNEAMPLIRYRIGDRGIWAAAPCSCGDPEPLLARVTGRATDVFRTADGRVIPAEFFIHMLGVVMNRGTIEKFQAIQKSLTHIQLKIVSPAIGAADIAAIEKNLGAALGDDVRIETILVDDIPLTPSGKFRYTINEMEERR